MTDFGKNLKDQRLKQGLTQSKLSGLTGGQISAGTICRIERGNRAMHTRHLIAFVEAMGITVEAIMGC